MLTYKCPQETPVHIFLKELRVELGVSQKDLAQRCGTQQSAISRFENGGHIPTIEFLAKLTLALGVKVQILI